jgi:uncharacterized Fe-S cluster-containing radical SAM superfamily protein
MQTFSSAASQRRKLDRKRFRQVLFSVPRYVREFKHVHKAHDVYQWTYYKVPYAFRLAAFPTRINLELTNECNLGCKHCPRSVMGRPLGFMPARLFSKITDEVARYPGTLIKVVGLGEPALHPQINDLMELIGERRIPSIVYTNGELFKACTAEQIVGWNAQTIIVSVDGLDAESFARIRVGGDYVVLKKLVSEFYAARGRRKSPEIEIRHVIFPKETQADLLRFRQEWLAISDTVKFNYLYFPEQTTEELRDTKCRDIRRELYVYWNGKVPLCGYQYLSGEQEWLGNVETSSIASLWNSERLSEVRRCHEARDLSELPFCKTCTFK